MPKLFELITETPEMFADWLLADKECIELSDGLQVGIETCVVLTECTDSCPDCEKDNCDGCDQLFDLGAIGVPQLSNEQYTELRNALLEILNQEV